MPNGMHLHLIDGQKHLSTVQTFGVVLPGTGVNGSFVALENILGPERLLAEATAVSAEWNQLLQRRWR